MVINVLPNDYLFFSQQFSFHPWQSGLLGDLMEWNKIVRDSLEGRLRLVLYSNIVKTVNMGRTVGHTYFARAAALKDFPIRTKVYATSTKNLVEYRDLLKRPQVCHELVDVLPETGFIGYKGVIVDLVVVDMCNKLIKDYADSLSTLYKSLQKRTSILLLQPSPS